MDRMGIVTVVLFIGAALCLIASGFVTSGSYAAAVLAGGCIELALIGVVTLCLYLFDRQSSSMSKT